MVAEIIAIGTEILLGDIVNTNASFLARELAALGISTYHQQVVGDNPGRLKEALESASESADIIITSGGLGPTGDDLTKETISEFFERPLHMDEKAAKHIEEFMVNLGRKLTDNQWKQAMLPEGCIPLYNTNGTAPGVILEAKGKILIMLPGPPSEIVPMFKEQVVPYLRSKSDKVLISRTMHISGIGEAAVEEALHEEMQTMSNPTLAPYAKEGIIDVRITARASSEEEAEKLIAPMEKKVRDLFGIYVIGADDETLEGVVVELLRKHGLKMATAESCTGGWVCSQIVSYPGASEVLEGGIVSYSNEVKMAQLGVKAETLAKYGAVSEETAREMAIGAAKLMKAEAAVSTTGIAGPTGGTKEKPVGMVCFGIYLNGEVTSFTTRYTRNRNSNRRFAVIRALNELRMRILTMYQ